MKLLLSFLLTATLAWAEARTLVLTGTVTNTTADNVSAPARLELVIDGATVSGRIVTSPPLSGTGPMTGRYLDGWCELSGNLSGNFTIKFRGVLNARDFRGTYTAKPSDGLMQYGRFDLAASAAAIPSTK